ncbi:MAG TPA: Ku protein [Stellaceae bacterium]|jgi:DNA end-binding protein Ku|nr:Ku protein [Stellaceae bacterium]
MAEAVWSGALRLSLVSCPIYLASATNESKRIKLERLSARTGNPVTEQFVDAKTGDVVLSDSLVKGYEFEASRYVTLSQEEVAKLGDGAGNIIDLEQFVPRDKIDRLHIEATYYIHPDGELAADTVHAVRLAMQRSGRAALGHIRLGEGDRPALIEPCAGGLMISTLRTAEELVQPDFVERPDDDIPGDMIEIAEAIITRRAADFDAQQLRDRYQDALRLLVDEKVKALPSARTEEKPRSRRASRPEAPTPPPLVPPPAPPEEAAVAAPPEEAAVAAPPPVPPPAPEPEPEAESVAAAPVPEPEPEAETAAPPPAPEPEPESLFAPPPPPPAPEPPPQPETLFTASSPPAPEPEPVVHVEETPEPEPEPVPETPAAVAAEGPQDVGTEILLHIMGLGDRRYVEPGWAGNPGSKRQIEALSIRPRDALAANAIEFRVFAQEGRATAWVSNGNYAGTRGRNLPLTGFAVRPSTDLGERLQITYEGSFFEGGVVGPKRNGELCVSPVADDPLEAVRVTIIDEGDAAE